MHKEPMNERAIELWAILGDCLRACQQCAVACLGEKDAHLMEECVRLDLDCAEACGLALSFLNRQSPNLEEACDFCSAICEECAEECAKHQHMEHCRLCADACRRCAEACADIATVAG